MSGTRRCFLAGMSALATSPLLALRALAAAPADAPSPARRSAGARVLVDWHSHYFSRAELAALSARATAPRFVRDKSGVARLANVDTASFAAGEPGEYTPSDVDARLRHLDKNGIERQLLTQTVALGFDATVPIAELRPLFRAVNDELAAVVSAHRDRFFAVAALPTADPAWAAQELKRAHEELGLIGGSLPLNAFASLEGARTLAPLFKQAQALRSHLFIHRGPASASVPGQPPLYLPTDSQSARWGIISNAHLVNGAITLGLTDFLDPYPDVSVQVIMLGGFLPYVYDTIIAAARQSGVADPAARLRRIHVDPGPYSRNGEWVKWAVAKLGADRILFGTDYGVGGGARGDVEPALRVLDEVLTPDQRRAIYVDNSRALLAAKGIAV